MRVLTATDVHASQHDAAIAALEHCPELRDVYAAELAALHPTGLLAYESSRGWLFIEVCGRCGDDIDLTESLLELDALCAPCEETEFGADAGVRAAG